MNKLEKVTEFVNKHTDEQCGLDVANVQVYKKFGRIRICISAKRPTKEQIKDRRNKRIKTISGAIHGAKEDWRCQAEDLIEEIGKDPRAIGKGLDIEFKLVHLHDTAFHLLEKDSK